LRRLSEYEAEAHPAQRVARYNKANEDNLSAFIPLELNHEVKT
jgi:hypothetical protein